MKITKALIQRYHLGQCTAEESAMVEHWLDNEEAEQSFPDELNLKTVEDKGWKKISERFGLDEVPVQRKVFRIPKIWSIAAAVLLVFSVAVVYIANRQVAPDLSAQQVYREIRASKGQKLSVTLADGTLVQLNSESTLRFPMSFAPNSRMVTFKGEAFFKVAKDASRPFSIKTKDTRVTVLGTRFNLRAYETETQSSVVVEEGRVRFSSNQSKDSLELIAGQRGVFTGTGKMQWTAVNTAKHLAWKDNELVFDDSRLGDIVQTLERWYGVDIEIKNAALKAERYSGQFQQPDLKTVLESLAFAIKFNYRLKDGVYHISP